MEEKTSLFGWKNEIILKIIKGVKILISGIFFFLIFKKDIFFPVQSMQEADFFKLVSLLGAVMVSLGAAS